MFKRIFLIMLMFNTLIAFGNGRKVMLLDSDWKFINKDIESAQNPTTSDANWSLVKVPHDWAIRQNFDMNLDAQITQVIEDGEKLAKLRTGRTGALPIYGVGWYRKHITLPDNIQNKRIFIEFDGAMSLAKIYLNNQYVGEWPYGYSSFGYELTNHVKPEEDNILAIRLENKPESSRWYTGAGLYRNVRLVIVPRIHVAQWGTYITTPSISSKKAEVHIQTQLNGIDNEQSKVKLVTEIYDLNNRKVAATETQKNIKGNAVFNQKLHIKQPQLWSIETPVLYKVVTKVFIDNVLLDEYVSKFGCRTIAYDGEKGFFLNGKHIKLKGVCMHHDLGPLGAAVNYRATERQMEIMKEMGVNAIRTSHNPPSPELLAICDSMGLMVQVEAFDEWKYSKNNNGYGLYFEQWAEKDLRNMVRRDRNHPSVIMWSIGNEIREQGHSQDGKFIAQFLADICRDEDPTRPVTAGFNAHNEAIKNGLADVIDLVGFNYKPHDYKNKKEANPHYILYGSETASTVSSRGEYKFPDVEFRGAWYQDYHLSSYDLEYPLWATTPDTEFEAQEDNEFSLGEFVWTGFDYLGEPTPYNEGTPARSSYFGIVDLAGLKKDRFYLYQSHWSKTPVLHLLPHWNWHDKLGQVVPVYCYTNYPKAELFVNGKSMGVLEKDKSDTYKRYRLMWKDVIYEPGEIKVIAYNNQDQAVAEKSINTSGTPKAIKLNPDRYEISTDGKDLSFVEVEILDKDGLFCPRANNLLFFNVEGPGVLKALCNGDPTDQTSFASNYMRAFNGKMVAIIESTEEAGEIRLNVSGGLLNPQTIIIQANHK